MPPKIRERGKNTYQLCVKDKQIQYYKTITCDSKAEAEKEWILYKAEILNNKVSNSPNRNMTVQELSKYYLDTHSEFESNTVSYYSSMFIRIHATLGHKKINDVTPKNIMDFLTQLKSPEASHLNKPLSKNTIKKHFTALKSLFNFAIKLGFINTTPFIRLDTPKVNRSKKEMPTPQEFDKFLNKVNKTENLKYIIWVHLAFGMGLRREEIFGISKQSINLKTQILKIKEVVICERGKGSIIKPIPKTDQSQRELKIPTSLFNMLTNYIKKEKCFKWLFTKEDGSVAGPESFNSFLKKLCKKHNLPNITPHILRHMYGSYLIKNNIPITRISKDLGHTDNSFTYKTYIHEIEKTDSKSANIMDEILSKNRTLNLHPKTVKCTLK